MVPALSIIQTFSRMLLLFTMVSTSLLASTQTDCTNCNIIFAPLDTVYLCNCVYIARPLLYRQEAGYCTVWIVERFGDFSHYAKYLTVHCALALCHCYHTIFIGGAYLETPVSVLSVRLVQVSL